MDPLPLSFFVMIFVLQPFYLTRLNFFELDTTFSITCTQVPYINGYFKLSQFFKEKMCRFVCIFVYIFVSESIDFNLFQDDVTEQEAEDAGANRAATLLYILKKVAYSSSVCEKKAISLLFHDYKERYLDLKLVGKVCLAFDLP